MNRQREILLTLLNNMNMALEMQATEVDSVGNAMKRYGEYSKSTEAKVNDFNNAMQKLWMNSINSDTINQVIDLGTELVNVVDSFGLVNSAVVILTGSLILFKGAAIKTTITEMIALNGVMGTLSTSFIAFATNPVTLVIAALGGLVIAQMEVNKYIEEGKKRAEEISSVYKDFNDAIDTGKIDEVTNALKRLTETVDYDNAIKKINQLKQEIVDLQNVSANESPIGTNLSFGMTDARIAMKQAELDKLQKEINKVIAARKVYEDLQNAPDTALNRRKRSTNTSNTNTNNFTPDLSSKAKEPDYEEQYQEQYQIISKLNFELDKQNEILSQKEDLDKIPILLERNKLLKEQQDNLHAINNARKEELAKLSPTSDRYQELIEKIQDTSLEWWKLNSAQSENLKNIDEINKKAQEALDKQNEEALKNLEDVQKQIVEIIKKRYELERDEAEKAHKEKLDNLKKEQEEFNKNIDAQIEAIERKRDAENYNDDINDLNEELSKLQNERAKYAMAVVNNDTEAISIVEDLDEKIADIQENIEDKQSDREYELKKQALQDLKEANDEEVEDQIETEEEKYEAIKENYDRLLTEGNLYAEANKSLTEGMVTDINGKLVTVAEAFKTFSDTFGQTLGTLGKNIQTEFIDKLNQAQMLINTMSGLHASTGIASNVSGLNTSTLSGNLLSGLNLSSILDKINLTSIIPSFTMPKINAMASGLNMGDININIAGSVTDKNINKINSNITTEIKNLFTKAGIKG